MFNERVELLITSLSPKGLTVHSLPNPSNLQPIN
jgi:hypothetical protein